MTARTVAVVGASGFVGSAFVQRLMREPSAKILPLIHSSGNAARLARHGLPLRMVDLLSPRSLHDALRDCTHVVNCARGNTEVLTRGFRNLVDASLSAGVQRFVHVSSVAVYGDLQPGEVRETLQTKPAPGTYGAAKLYQDQVLEAAVTRGLPAVVLCPPNISGPHSPFLLEFVDALRTGHFAIVDNGSAACELIDVENLVHAMRLALEPHVTADGKRLFVTDCAGASWRDLVERLRDLAEPVPALTELDRGAAARLAAPQPQPSPSLRRAIEHLISSEVRDALRKDPLIAKIEGFAKSVAIAMPARVEKALRRRADGAGAQPDGEEADPVSIPLVRQQLRDVRYSCERAHVTLGYVPVVSFPQSMNAFRLWYEQAFGWNTEWWPLLSQLYS